MRSKLIRISYVSFLILLLILPTIFAAPTIGQGFTTTFSKIAEWTHNPRILPGVVFILMFVLLYGIYAAAISFIPAFQGANARNARIVGVAISLLATTAMFALTPITTVVQNILSTFAFFGGVVLAFFFAATVYYGFRGGNNEPPGWGVTTGSAAIGLIFVGSILNNGTWTAWGMMLVVVSIIFGLVSARFNLFGAGGGNGPPQNDPPVPGAPEQVQNVQLAQV